MTKAGGLYEMGREIDNLYLCKNSVYRVACREKAIKAPGTRQTPRTGLLAELMSKGRDAVLLKNIGAKHALLRFGGTIGNQLEEL